MAHGRRTHLVVFARDGRRVFWSFYGLDIREYDAPTPVDDRPPAAAPSHGPPLVRKLSAPLEDVVVGGGGRYLCMKLKGRAVAIFDVNAAAVIKTIELDADRALIAAAFQLVVAYPGEPSFAMEPRLPGRARNEGHVADQGRVRGPGDGERLGRSAGRRLGPQTR